MMFRAVFWVVLPCKLIVILHGSTTQKTALNFLDVLREHDIFGIAGSWTRFEGFEIKGFISCWKGRSKVAKCDRNPGGLAVYIGGGGLAEGSQNGDEHERDYMDRVSKKRDKKIDGLCLLCTLNLTMA
jgi:hypothetical protein